MDIKDVRREYLRDGLRRHHLDKNPIAQFKQWLQQAIDEGITDPTAMVLATVDQHHRPSQRIVLLKQCDQQGLVFFTNKCSHKAQAIADNTNVSLHFPWHNMERQVIIGGVATLLEHTEVEAYFHSRPETSQLAAWASAQSQPLASRDELMDRFSEIKQQFEHDIPVPDFWGGYRVTPQRFEFWQGGEHRLHDRFIYERASEPAQANDEWHIQRLAP